MKNSGATESEMRGEQHSNYDQGDGDDDGVTDLDTTEWLNWTEAT